MEKEKTVKELPVGEILMVIVGLNENGILLGKEFALEDVLLRIKMEDSYNNYGQEVVLSCLDLLIDMEILKRTGDGEYQVVTVSDLIFKI